MPDLFHLWGNDLVAGPGLGRVDATGDLLTVGTDNNEIQNDSDLDLSGMTLQRLLRRLLTNPGEYLWQPTYGAGLGRFMGQPLNKPAMTAIIRSQIFLEAAVSQTPAPIITLTAQKDGSVLCHILYSDAETGKPVPLSFSITS